MPRSLVASALALLVVGGIVLAAVLVSGSRAAPRAASALIQRTFVSTSGNDANPCTRAEPCRNFAAAIANTVAGGEVVALDSGGYGAVTITKAVTIAGAPGAHVAITAFSNQAVLVDAGAEDTVILRNLFLTGLGAQSGVHLQSAGSLHVESVVASGFSTGLFAAADGAKVFVADSRFRHNFLYGVYVDGDLAVEIENTSSDANVASGYVFTGGAVATVRRSAARRNGDYGFNPSLGAQAAIEDSLAEGNEDGGVGVGGDGTTANLSRDVLANNPLAGLITFNAGSVARIGGSTVSGNGTGLLHVAGTLESYGDNLVRGNTVNTSGTITAVGKT